LSPYRWDSERLGIREFVEKNRDLLSTDLATRGHGKIRIGTIQSFKGLEADVVILCGIDGYLPACSPTNLFVGATRARSMLYVVHSSQWSLRTR
jgi:superfamily I DNA/RNA helicase